MAPDLLAVLLARYINPMTDPYDIDMAACRGRQKRVLAEMQRLKLDLVIVQKIEHVQWLAGPRFGPMFEPAAALDERRSFDLGVAECAAGEGGGRRQPGVRCQVALDNAQRPAGGVVAGAVGGACQPARFEADRRRVLVLFAASGRGHCRREFIDIEPDLYRLRRRKDADELARLKKAIAATGVMYQTAREMIRPA